MQKKFLAIILSLALFICIDSGSTAVTNERISRVHLGKENGVLDENIKVTIVDADDEGKPIFRQWTPSASGIEETGNVHVEDSKAKFRINEGEEINGVIKGNPLFSDGGYKFGKANSRNNNYIDWKGKPTYARKCNKNTRVKATVETVIVCDKEFGDLFNHDYQKISNYLVVNMWDINMRFKSLPSSDISFQVNGIVVIANTSAQPFIQNAKGPPDGRVQIGRILELFSRWANDQKENLPPHDLIPLVTNAELKYEEGLAWVGGACNYQNRNYFGTLVWKDTGNYRSYLGASAIGQSLGARRDDDPNFPGGCSERGFIEGYDGSDNLGYFFSNCSDRLISNFLRSESASCLRTLSSNKPPVLDPSFDNPKAPSILAQCRKFLRDPEATVDDKDPNSCKTQFCRLKIPDPMAPYYAYQFIPIDNSECPNGGRCFRGFCRQLPQFFKNVGSGLCIQASNPFSNAAPFVMVECPSPGTPLDKLFVKEGNSGTMLLSPFQMGTEVGERCGYTGNAEGDTIKTDRCDVNNKQQGWDFNDVGNNQFLLKHVSSGKCAKPESNNTGSLIGTYMTCDSKDNNMKWERF